MATSDAKVLGYAAALGGAAAASFVLGRWSASLEQGLPRSQEPAQGVNGVAAADGAATNGVKEAPRSSALTEMAASVGMDELLKFLSQLPPKPLVTRTDGEDQVHSTAKAVILCASGKGGVGKSTVSVNLAFTLAGMGVDVGLLDLDIYGPSLPELIPLPPASVMQNRAGRIIPLEYGGVALMSWGYIQPGEAATIRAPIVSQITTQFLSGIEWGALDVLIVDTPPGTGDVLLSIAQTMPVDGAVIVTTLNNISFADVRKGVQLFEKVNIPPLVVAANMSTFPCEGCGRSHDLFADSALEQLPKFLEEKGIGLVKLPLDPMLSATPERPCPPIARQYPFVRNPDNEARPAFGSLCGLTQIVLERLLGAGRAGGSEATAPPATLKLRPGGTVEVRLKGGELRPMAAGELRAACRCALCIDEMTGEVKIDCDAIRRDTSLRVTGVEPRGNYAASVTFSDGHQSLIALRALEQLVGAGAAAGAAAARGGKDSAAAW